MSIRIGVLGAGWHSLRCHGPALKILCERDPSLACRAAVCDKDRAKAQKYAADFGFEKVYDDLDEMLRCEKLDGLLAITPIALTEALATRLLPAGIPLLIEKPMGGSIAEARRIVAAAAASGTPNMVSFNRRFNPALQKARQWIDEDPQNRRPLLVLARMLRHERREADFAFGTGLHMIDAVCSIAGKPTAVRCDRLTTGPEGAMLFSAHMAFEGSALAEVALAPDVGMMEETYEIMGRDFTIFADAWRGRLRIMQGAREVLAWQAGPNDPPVYIDGTVDETAAFIASIGGRRPWGPTAADALVSMTATDAIQRGLCVELS